MTLMLLPWRLRYWMELSEAPGDDPRMAASVMASSLGRGGSAGSMSNPSMSPPGAPLSPPPPPPAPPPAPTPTPTALLSPLAAPPPTRCMAVRQSLTKEASGRASGRKSASAWGVRRMAPSAALLPSFRSVRPLDSSANAASSELIVADRACGACCTPTGSSHSYSYSMMYSGSTSAGSSATHDRCLGSSLRARHTLWRSLASASALPSPPAAGAAPPAPSSSSLPAPASTGMPVRSSSSWQLPRNTLAIMTTPLDTSAEYRPRAEYRMREPPILACGRDEEAAAPGWRARSSSSSNRVPDLSTSSPASPSQRAGSCCRPTTGMWRCTPPRASLMACLAALTAMGVWWPSPMAPFSICSHCLLPVSWRGSQEPVCSSTADTDWHSRGMSAMDRELVSGTPVAGEPDACASSVHPASRSALRTRRSAIFCA